MVTEKSLIQQTIPIETIFRIFSLKWWFQNLDYVFAHLFALGTFCISTKALMTWLLLIIQFFVVLQERQRFDIVCLPLTKFTEKKRWIFHWSNSRAKKKSIGRFLILFQIQNDSSRNEWDRFHGVEFSEVGKTCHHKYTRLMSKQHMQIWSDMDEDIYKSVDSV